MIKYDQAIVSLSARSVNEDNVDVVNMTASIDDSFIPTIARTIVNTELYLEKRWVYDDDYSRFSDAVFNILTMVHETTANNVISSYDEEDNQAPEEQIEVPDDVAAILDTPIE